MPIVTVTNRDGTTSQVDMNAGRLGHCVDADGNYLGMVDPAAAFKHVAAPPAQGTWKYDFATDDWVEQFTLTELKAAKWDEIREARNQTEYGGFATPYGTFDSDNVSQTRIIGAVTAAGVIGSTFTITWTRLDNTNVQLDQTSMVTVGLMLMAHVNACHQAGDTLREAINAATTVQQLEGIAWSGVSLS